MLSEGLYNQICQKLVDDGFDSSYIVDFSSIQEKWDEMIDINENKVVYAQLHTDNLTLSNLFSLRWGITAISLSHLDKSDMMAFQGLFSTISNTVLAINELAIDGLDYQASVLIRSLYELCFMLLAIIIDPEKRKALCDGAANNDEYNTWKKHFSFKQLDYTIRRYEQKIAIIEPDSFLNTWRRKNYSSFSSYVHNDFATFLLYGMAKPSHNSDKLHLNLWGALSSRADVITGNINALLWYVELLFMRLLADTEIDIKPEVFCKTDVDRNLWNFASFIGIFAKEYYIQIRNDATEQDIF